RGARKEHRFVIKNASHAPVELVIRSVSCACAKASLERRTLQPDEETILSAALDTSRGKGDRVQTDILLKATSQPSSPEVIARQQFVRLRLTATPDQER